MLANVLRWSSSPHDQGQNALPEQIWNTFRCAGCKFGAFPSDAGNQRTFCVYRSINSENRSATQRRFGDHLDQDARNAGWSDPSSTENSTGIISFVMTLPGQPLKADLTPLSFDCFPTRHPSAGDRRVVESSPSHYGRFSKNFAWTKGMPTTLDGRAWLRHHAAESYASAATSPPATISSTGSPFKIRARRSAWRRRK